MAPGKFKNIILAGTAVIFILAGCRDTTTSFTKDESPEINEDSFGEATLGESTTVLDEETLDMLVNVSGDGSVFTFQGSNASLENLETGRVMVMGVSSATPLGALRKVESIQNSGSTTIVSTSQATIEEAFQHLELVFSMDLQPSQVDSIIYKVPSLDIREKMSRKTHPSVLDEAFNIEIDVTLYEDPNRPNDYIKLKGQMTLTQGINFELERTFLRLDRIRMAMTGNVNCTLELDASIQRSIDESKLLYQYWFAPIVLPGPVVLTPHFTVTIGLEGSAVAQMTAFVETNLDMEAGMEYLSGNWNPITSFQPSFNSGMSELQANAAIKAYASPQFDLKLYGFTGPYVGITGYGDVSWDWFRSPKFQIHAGIDAFAGAQMRIFGREIANYQLPDLYNYRRLIFEAGFDEDDDRGTLSGSVRDATTQNPIEGVSVVVTDRNQQVTASGSTNSQGSYEFSVPEGSNYLVTYTKDGFIPANYRNISIVASETTHLSQVLYIDRNFAGPGTIEGRIVNALTGQGVAGLSLAVTEEFNNRGGTVIRESETRSDGTYSLDNMEAGYYTITASAEGYNSTSFNAIAIGGQVTGNQNATITPSIDDTEIRIVLTWGEHPRDLDAHLTGPTPDGQRFHIFYANMSYQYQGTPYARLDRDDTNSYGPETITIYEQVDGVYRYSVHDFTNRQSSSSFALSNSNAQVALYFGENEAARFNVPSNREGTLWTVFELDGQEIRPVNEMTYESSPGSVQKGTVAGK